MFGDWQARGVTSVLHEKPGGYANNAAAIYGLAGKAESEGVRILTGIQVTGFGMSGAAVSKVQTDRGDIDTDYVVADDITDDKPALLTPFRFSRFEEGDLRPASNSPFPWS